MVVSFARISANSEVFSDQCILNGFVPPHPGDVERAIKLANSAKALSKDAIVVMTEPDDDDQDKNNATEYSKELPELTEEEMQSIIYMVTKSQSPLSQKTINKVHETFKHISTRDARKIIKSLITKGEIQMPEEE